MANIFLIIGFTATVKADPFLYQPLLNEKEPICNSLLLIDVINTRIKTNLSTLRSPSVYDASPVISVVLIFYNDF